MGRRKYTWENKVSKAVEDINDNCDKSYIGIYASEGLEKAVGKIIESELDKQREVLLDERENI